VDAEAKEGVSMISTEFWRRIDNILGQYDLLRHPFYRAWMQGKLTRSDLCEYSMEYYHQVESFPKYLREFARRLPAGELRQEVYQNLCDEEGIGSRDNRSHASIWMSFAEEMGAEPGMVRIRTPQPKTQQLIAMFFDFAQSGSEAEALATFYA
jgi:pyrroloquinoline-quinone synthase